MICYFAIKLAQEEKYQYHAKQFDQRHASVQAHICPADNAEIMNLIIAAA